MARETALTVQTISNIVEELEACGLLLAGTPTQGARGQPSVPYRINPRGACALGFHIDHRMVVGALVDLMGAPVATESVPASRPGPTEAAEILRGLAARLLARGGGAANNVLGAGVALPVRFGVGPITTAGPTTLPGWDDPAATTRISEAIGHPVLIENDAMAAAIGERLGGAARDITSFVFLFLDDGLGAGIFIDGQPWRGASRNAGEIGHMVVEPGGLSCSCGNHGCLERYVSLRAAYEALLDHPDEGAPRDLEAMVEPLSPALAAWIAEAAPRLARAVGILEATLDPDTIILGGVAPRGILARLVEAVSPLPVSVGMRADRALPRIMLGGTGSDLVALGAAALPIFNEITPRFDVMLKR